MTKRFKEDPNGDWEVTAPFIGLIVKLSEELKTNDFLVIRRVEEPMPEILPGDAFVFATADRVVLLVKCPYAENFFIDIFDEMYSRNEMTKHYRNGKLIWERKR